MKSIFLWLLLLVSSMTSFASEEGFVGKYLLEYSLFKIDVYEIAYYKSKDAERLVLDYKIDVKKEHSIQGWKVGLKHRLSHPEYTQKIDWLLLHTADMEKGERLSLIKKNGTLEIHKNEKLIALTNDSKIVQIAFEPWLGDHPVDEKLKSALLGKR